MRALALLWSTLSVTAAASAAAQSSQDLGVTLADVRRLSKAELAERINGAAGPELQLRSVNVHRAATTFVFESAVRPAGRGICGARRVTIEAKPAVTAEWGIDPDARIAVPPPQWHTAPLRIESRTQSAIFHVLPGRAPSIGRTRAACARLGPDSAFFAAADAVAARRAARILDAFRELMRRDPGAIRANCGGLTDCREQLARLSVNAFASFEECSDSTVSPEHACAIFIPRPRETMWSYNYQSYRLETITEPGGDVRVLSFESTGVMID